MLFWVPLLVLHESGHALAAWLLGWHFSQMVIGVGRLIYSFRWAGALIEIRMFPVQGFILCAPTNLRRPQVKSALIYFAGPGVELLLALVVLLLVGPAQLFAQTESYWLITWQSLALAATAQALLNLIPGAVWTPRGSIANDGLGIFRSLTLPNSYYAAMIAPTRQSSHHTLDDDSPQDVVRYEREDPWDDHDPADWWKRQG